MYTTLITRYQEKPVSNPINELSWSPLRHATFEECKRKYYYQYYLSNGGQDYEAAPEAKLAWRLNSLRDIDAFIQTLIRDEISKDVVDRKGGGLGNIHEYEVAEKVDEALDTSASKEPKDASFSQDYYGHPLSDEEKEVYRQKAVTCLRTYPRTELCTVQENRSRGHKFVWIEEALSRTGQTFMLEDCAVTVQPDFAFRINGMTMIGDFRSGEPASEDVIARACYGLLATKAWGCTPEDLLVFTNHLYPELSREKNHPVTSEALSQTEDMILASYRGMKALVDDKNSANEDDFPMATDGSSCQSCSFRQICGRLNEDEKGLPWLSEAPTYLVPESWTRAGGGKPSFGGSVWQRGECWNARTQKVWRQPWTPQGSTSQVECEINIEPLECNRLSCDNCHKPIRRARNGVLEILVDGWVRVVHNECKSESDGYRDYRWIPLMDAPDIVGPSGTDAEGALGDHLGLGHFMAHDPMELNKTIERVRTADYDQPQRSICTS